ncbi:MAG: glutathione peroxidase [Myxococcales bacterium]|nr:glutathione peroxidase [Myxococcales bacterium]
MSPIHRIEVETIDGETRPLAEYAGKALLIVNTASQCGFTPQYAELEALWRTWRDRGLVVLGFPCNQFGAQEPGDAAEIAQFCSLRYEVSFPMHAKIEVNGAGAHPLYRHLKAAQPGLLGTRAIKWNFTKFLVNPAGEVVGRYGPHVNPSDAKFKREVERVLPGRG